ncbi:MAG: hypothetical protein IJ087_00125 [Eggerthellaceae bacterium]|nr:hypothetical protein [Eggerthellaceae bacterium]
MSGKKVCGNCGRSRMETHTGDSQLVCWKDRSCGVPVERLETCPAWIDQSDEPIGEYADVLLRRVRNIAIELDAAKAVAKQAFMTARALYNLASQDAMPVEYAIRLNIIVDELADLGIEVD